MDDLGEKTHQFFGNLQLVSSSNFCLQNGLPGGRGHAENYPQTVPPPPPPPISQMRSEGVDARVQAPGTPVPQQGQFLGIEEMWGKLGGGVDF